MLISPYRFLGFINRTLIPAMKIIHTYCIRMLICPFCSTYKSVINIIPLNRVTILICSFFSSFFNFIISFFIHNFLFLCFEHFGQ